MKKITVISLSAILLFLCAQKLGIELNQNGFCHTGFYFIVTSHILKVVFLVFLVVFMYKGVRCIVKNVVIRIFLGALCLPFFLFVCGMTMSSGRVILNLSRPTQPEDFIKDQVLVQKLTDLANEMIQQRNVFWVGNRSDYFIFSIRYGDGDYQFDSRLIAECHDFNEPVKVEDMSIVHHFDLPFQSDALKPTDEKVLDPNDYAFCQRASNIVRKAGFDTAKLYDEQNVIQYQIYDFIGWDNGGYFVYYFCPDTTLPEEFSYDRKLNGNWYYIWKPRFSK